MRKHRLYVSRSEIPYMEYEDRVWGAETNVFEAGRSQDIEGDYEEIISGEILSWPDMLPGM